MSKRSTYFLILVDFLFLCLVSAIIVSFLYTGDVPGGSDWSTHLSKIKYIIDSFPKLTGWYTAGGFGGTFLQYYPPLSYYLAAIITWVLGVTVFEGSKNYFIFVLSIGAISTYVLARELGLKRNGCLTASLLLLGSYNIYAWWWIGQLPNMTAFMFTPLALWGFIRALRKNSMSSILLAGLTYVPVLLSHTLNTFILGIILLATGIFMIFFRKELLFVSRGSDLPPKYTLILPKVLFVSIFEAFLLAAWWWLPFLTSSSAYISEMAGYGVISAGETATSIALKLDSLISTSSAGGLYYAGIGQLILVIGCLLYIIKFRKNVRDTEFLPAIWFFVCILGAISPYLGIPFGLPYRFGPYMSLAGALMGGIIVSALENHYRTLLTKNIYATPKRIYKHVSPYLKTILATFFFVILLANVLYLPLTQAISNFPMHNSEAITPTVVSDLSGLIKSGERLGTSSTNWINVYSDITQTYGVETWTNTFAYTFWYYMYYNYTPELTPYFASSFNVKYFWEPPKGSAYLSKVNDSVYEVVGFNSSLVETTEGKVLVLFIGDEAEYTRMFLSIGLSNPQDILLVYGGRLIENYDLQTLQHFNVIYLSGVIYSNLPTYSDTLQQYVTSGGGLILDTGVLEYSEVFNNLPEIFPVTSTASKNSIFNLTIATDSVITSGINLGDFWKGSFSSSNQSVAGISYADNVRDGATVILRDGNEAIMAYWEYGSGSVIWYGLRLPYYVMLHSNIEESKLLVNMIKDVASPIVGGNATVSFDYNVDQISVNVNGATSITGILVKVTDAVGWVASVGGQDLELFEAGPDMMLVFPTSGGNYELNLNYGATTTVIIGDILAIVGCLLIVVTFLKSRLKIREGWNKTAHNGKYLKQPRRTT